MRAVRGSEVEVEPEVESESTTAPVEVDTVTGDHDRFAHLVYSPVPGEAEAMVTKAMVLGLPLIALCRKVWIPSRDGSRFPLCHDCRRIRDRMMGPGEPGEPS